MFSPHQDRFVAKLVSPFVVLAWRATKMPAVSSKISGRASAGSIRAAHKFECQTLDALRLAQITYINEKVKGDPGLICKVIGLIDAAQLGRGESRFISSCVRKFGGLTAKVCCAIIETLLQEKKCLVRPITLDAGRNALCHLLGLAC